LVFWTYKLEKTGTRPFFQLFLFSAKGRTYEHGNRGSAHRGLGCCNNFVFNYDP